MAADPSFVVGIIGQFAAHRRHQGIAFWLSLFISSNRIDRRVLCWHQPTSSSVRPL
jgi:hypothetical protein